MRLTDAHPPSEQVVNRRIALELATTMAAASGEVIDAHLILQDAGRFADFILEDKREV